MTNTPAAIQRMIDATNAGDTDAFIDAFTENAYLEDWGRQFHGHDGVRSWDATDNIGRQAHFVVENVGQRGDEWVVTVTVSGNGFNGTSPIAFTLDGDRIARMVIAP